MVKIIGGGPSGSYAAYLLAKKGYDVDLYEEHEKIGDPVQCTGIVTHSLQDIVRVKKDVIANKIKLARIISPDNNHIDFRFRHDNLILWRNAFDRQIGDMAHDAGADIHYRSRYVGNTEKKIRIKDLQSNKTSEKKFSYLVGSDGPLSQVAKQNSLYGKRSMWVGAQVKAKLENENIVEFYPHIGTFAWVVPEDDKIVRIGLFAELKEGNKVFERFLKTRLGEDYKKKIVCHESGIEPKYDPLVRTEKKNIFLLGDAATQVKATSGGGIIQGMLAAEGLADAISSQKSYEKEWRKRIGRDLWMHLKMREMMDRFSEKDWNRLVGYFSQDKLREVLEKEDRDYPTRFMTKILMREPRILQYIRFFR